MAEVLLVHHAMGQTAGFHAFADVLRQAGHTVHTPDLFDGRTFASIADGIAFVEQLGFVHFVDVGARSPRACPTTWSTSASRSASWRPRTSPRPGRGPAGQSCATPSCRSTRSAPGRKACPPRCTAWTPTRCFTGEGDLDDAREVVDSGAPVELFLYPGDQHYFADASLPSYVPEAAELLTSRVLAFLADH